MDHTFDIRKQGSTSQKARLRAQCLNCGHTPESHEVRTSSCIFSPNTKWLHEFFCWHDCWELVTLVEQGISSPGVLLIRSIRDGKKHKKP